MKKSALLSLVIIFGCHSKPVGDGSAPPTYIVGDISPSLKEKIPLFPARGSFQQTNDEADLRGLQKTRTAKDCQRAATEVIITLQSFYGKPYGFLDDHEVDVLTPFFQKIREESSRPITRIKDGYNRLRPYDYIPGLQPCVRKETSFAYPSGHATLATEYALVLNDLFPQKTDVILKRRDQLARDRVMAGVHHPTDIEAGKNLGALLHEELLKSKAYNDDVDRYKNQLK